MPIYEFRCSNGHTFEVMRSISADPLTACETCSAPVERVFHPIAVHFKGSGFYNTDYGTKKRSREAKEYESSKSEKSEKSEKSSKDGASKDGAAAASSSSSDSKSSGSDSSSSSKSDSGAAKTPSKASSD